MIVPSCKIHNDASCDISNDGKLLATFVPSAQGFPDDGVVAVYSLEKEYFGQCVFSKKFGKDSKTRVFFNRIFFNKGVHVQNCIMGNQGKMAGNSKICFRNQSQLILPEFIYLMLSL